MAVKVSKDDSYNSKGESYKQMLDKGGKGDNLPSWFGRSIQQNQNELGNFFQDRLADSGNLLGWLTGLPQGHTGDEVRDRLAGMGLPDTYRRPSGDSSGQYDDTPGGRTGGRARPNVGQSAGETSGPLTFSDYLRMANEISGGGTDYSALMEQLKSNASGVDAKLESMYRALRGSIDADAPVISQTFDQAGQQIGQSGEQAAAQTQAGYDAARAAQTAQFAALGIGDAAGVLAANGSQAATDQAAANANIRQNQLANQNLNTQKKSTALDYNVNIGNAAGLDAATQRARLQQDLANKLAELQTQQSKEAGDRKSSAFETAFTMAQNPGIFDPNYKGDPKADLEMQMLAQQIIAQQYKNQGLAANSSQGIGANLSQYQALAQAMGVDPSDPTAFMQFIEMVKATQ